MLASRGLGHADLLIQGGQAQVQAENHFVFMWTATGQKAWQDS